MESIGVVRVYRCGWWVESIVLLECIGVASGWNLWVLLECIGVASWWNLWMLLECIGVASGWNLWVLLECIGVASGWNLWVLLECMDVVSGCGCKEVYTVLRQMFEAHNCGNNFRGPRMPIQ